MSDQRPPKIACKQAPIRATALLGLFLLFSTIPVFLRAQEVQHHGLVFEEWIRDTFFDGYRPPSYTQKWDIPAAVNKKFGGVPVNPKWRIAGES